jgi:hypothetical protein
MGVRGFHIAFVSTTFQLDFVTVMTVIFFLSHPVDRVVR